MRVSWECCRGNYRDDFEYVDLFVRTDTSVMRLQGASPSIREGGTYTTSRGEIFSTINCRSDRDEILPSARFTTRSQTRRFTGRNELVGSEFVSNSYSFLVNLAYSERSSVEKDETDP